MTQTTCRSALASFAENVKNDLYYLRCFVVQDTGLASLQNGLFDNLAKLKFRHAGVGLYVPFLRRRYRDTDQWPN